MSTMVERMWGREFQEFFPIQYILNHHGYRRGCRSEVSRFLSVDLRDRKVDFFMIQGLWLITVRVCQLGSLRRDELG